MWSDEDRPGCQGPPDQRRHGPGVGPDVQRQAHTDTAGHCLSQFTHADRGERHTWTHAHANMHIIVLLVLSFLSALDLQTSYFHIHIDPKTFFFHKSNCCMCVCVCVLCFYIHSDNSSCSVHREVSPGIGRHETSALPSEKLRGVSECVNGV